MITPTGWAEERIPPDALPAQSAAVAWAVLGGARSLRDLCAVLGARSPDTARAWRAKARELGLIRFDEGLANATGPALRVVEPPSPQGWVVEG